MMTKKETGVVDIRGKQYQTVALRVQRFREEHPDFALTTQIIARDNDCVVMQAAISAPDGRVLATGHSEEKRTSSQINRTSALENAETSAIGRALAALGMGGTEFASANEVQSAVQQQEAGGQSDSTVSPRSSNDEDIRWVELVQLIEATGTKTGELLQHYNAPDLNALSAKDAADAVRKLRAKLAKLAFPEGPAPNITTLKQLSGQLYREVAGCGDASELDALLAVPENAALLKQMAALETPAHKELWTGDGKDSPGLAGLISAKEREFAAQVPDRVPA